MADKREFHYFVLSEYEEEEKYLNDMAQKGYLLEKITLPGIYSFKKCEPVNMIYRIDFNPQRQENRESYLQMFQDYGWEYIQDLNDFSFFRKIDDGADDEIFSDNESRIEMMERITKRKMLPILVIFLCCVIPQASRVITGVDLSEGISIAIYIVWVVLLVAYVFAVSKCIIGFRRLKKKYGLK